MPFDDERGPVVLVAPRVAWVEEFAVLAMILRDLELAEFAALEHVGSTAVTGLVAKDVLDVQIRLDELNVERTEERFETLGFRRRPEEWNNVEASRTGPEEKLVFAAPRGARRANIHVRKAGSSGARDTLLFRDYLRGNDVARDEWGRFKVSLLEGRDELDLSTYGQAKQPAWYRLMASADEWATHYEWVPGVLAEWPSGSR